jgi:hypothetical protein
MEKEFVPYELALKLKALGFDEPCLAIYSNANPKTGLYTLKKYRLKLIKQASQKDKGVKAPLYQQAFRWFRDEHGISGSIQIEHDAYQWSIFEEGETSGLASDNWDGTDYEEAELACLEKLIEIVESKTE